MALQTGTQAPEFTLKSKNAEGLSEISLTTLRKEGPVVVLFFPFAFTSVCQEELCTVSGGLAEYADLKAQVVGISVDSPFAQEAFSQKNAIKIPLLSDFNKEVSRAYDVLYESFLPDVLGFAGVSKRSAFVIDTEGVIRYSWSSDNPKDLPSFEDIKAALRSC
jgi:glutaredoxin-dependent peroxiredoxin